MASPATDRADAKQRAFATARIAYPVKRPTTLAHAGGSRQRAFFLGPKVVVSGATVAFRRGAAKSQKGLEVRIPAPADDRPALGRVGIIAVVGFVIGILWPRLAGVKMVPSPPSDEGEPAAAAEPVASGKAADAPPASKAEPVEDPKPAPAPAAADRVKISDPKITSCRDGDGNKKSECGELDIESIAKARIQTLGACSGAENAHGTLSLGLELDFQKKKIVDLQRGKSTTLADGDAKALMACAKKEFEAASLDGVKHEHAAYTVFYIVELVPPSEAKPGAAEGEDGVTEGEATGDVTAASGRATVSWDVAIIRSEPKEGEIVARILRGTRVVVTGRKDDWYRIKYDAKGTEGWVFKGAIGL